MGGCFLHLQGLIDVVNQIFILTNVPSEQGTAIYLHVFFNWRK
jgi:hypothetical protein